MCLGGGVSECDLTSRPLASPDSGFIVDKCIVLDFILGQSSRILSNIWSFFPPLRNCSAIYFVCTCPFFLSFFPSFSFFLLFILSFFFVSFMLSFFVSLLPTFLDCDWEPSVHVMLYKTKINNRPFVQKQKNRNLYEMLP